METLKGETTNDLGDITDDNIKKVSEGVCGPVLHPHYVRGQQHPGRWMAVTTGHQFKLLVPITSHLTFELVQLPD